MLRTIINSLAAPSTKEIQAQSSHGTDLGMILKLYTAQTSKEWMNIHRALTVKCCRRFGSTLGSIKTEVFVRLYLLFYSWASISKLEEGKTSIYSDNNSISYNQNDSGPSPSPSNSLSSVGAAASPTKFASLSPLTNNSDLAIPQVGRVSTPAKALLDHAETM